MINNVYAETKIEDSLPDKPKSIESTLISFVPMILIFLVFYFLLIRPQEKKRKAQEQIINNIKKGDEVITSSGIFGKIVKINESNNSFDLEIAEGLIIKITKNSVINIIVKK
jgi:preprotein translocase subunit YajC